MQLLQRKIAEIDLYFFGKCGRQLLVNYVGFLLAHRALKIAENDHRHRSRRRSQRRSSLHVQLVQIGLKRALIDIERFTLEDFLAVLGHEKMLDDGVAVERQMDSDVQKSRQLL